jgi:uncharacterized membrane protein
MTNETNNKAVSVTDEPKNPIVNDRGLAFVVYVLYLVGYFTGITTVIGVIIAYLQRASASSSSILRSHNTFQLRTFWIGLLYLVVGLLLLHFGVGVLVLLWWFVWSLVRNIKGLLTLNRNEPIANPESWMFGD